MFIEIIDIKKANIVACHVHKHHSMDFIDFNNHLNQIFKKISKEQKQIFLFEHFNINLLHYNVH